MPRRCQGICTDGQERMVKRVVSIYIFHRENYRLVHASSSYSVGNNKQRLCKRGNKAVYRSLRVSDSCGESSLNPACNLHESSYRSSFNAGCFTVCQGLSRSKKEHKPIHPRTKHFICKQYCNSCLILCLAFYLLMYS